MSEIPVFSVIVYQNGMSEEPGFRNEGVLRIGDDEIQITTTWWNWARHMAWPLGVLTTDFAIVFAGPSSTKKVVLTIHRDQIESVSMRPDAEPRPSSDVVGTRDEDGKRWRCSFAYRDEDAAFVQQLEAAAPAEAAT